MIEVEGVSKVYRTGWRSKVEALTDVSFTCGTGRILGLMGENGAGKSTLLRILATMIKPGAGHARVAGFDVVREGGAVRRRIGFASMNTGLNPRLTVREFLIFNARLHGLTENEARSGLDTMADLLHLSAWIDRTCDRLSSGQKQRVNLARTLLHDPEVLILDEPTTGLDLPSIQIVFNFLQQVRRQGRTVLLSTHQVAEVEALCDDVVFLHRGRLVHCGPLSDWAARWGSLTAACQSIMAEDRIS